MNTDTFFTQGNSHKICQDYAVHGPDYVILSDGCSGAMDSDFGARLLVRAAIVHNHESIIPIYDRILSTAVDYCKAIDLNSECLFATLLTAKVLECNIEVHVAGDGIIAVKFKNGVIRVVKITYPMSAPLYLRYFLSPQDCGSFFNNYEGKYTETTYTITPNGKTENLRVEQCSCPRPNFHCFAPDFDSYKIYCYDKFDVESVAIFSDGVASFQRFTTVGVSKTSELVPEEEIIKEILAFRGFQGEFVQRRCQRAFVKFDKDGWRNFDDFSVGVIYTGETK